MKQTVLLVATLLLLTSACFADTVPFTWTTTGSFSPTLTGVGFSGTTGSAPAPGLSVGDTLDAKFGSFTLTTYSGNATGQFDLNLNFSKPDGVSPYPGTSQAKVTATIITRPRGSEVVTITDFQPVEFAFNWTDPDKTWHKGTFTVDNLVVGAVHRNPTYPAGESVDLSGTITFKSYSTPEAGTIAEFLTLASGLVFFARKRLFA